MRTLLHRFVVDATICLDAFNVDSLAISGKRLSTWNGFVVEWREACALRSMCAAEWRKAWSFVSQHTKVEGFV